MLLALIARGIMGRGQLVDVALLDSVARSLTYQANRYFATGEPPARTGNRHTAIAPYDTFDTADGVLILAVGNDDQWRSWCRPEGACPRGGRTLQDECRSGPRPSGLARELDRILTQQPAAAWVKALRTPACRAEASGRSTRCSRIRS
jgi:crotonobetainyl-CoA:carnitine CoA-transferase CaiB-like acyl-CoA transferase